MGTENAEAVLSVPAEILPELRRALLEDLLRVGVAVQDMVSEKDRDLREARYRELVVRLITRHQVHETAGWPDDPKLDGLIIRGEHTRTLAIDCLIRRRDRCLDLREMDHLRDEPKPGWRGSVAWPGEHSQPAPYDSLKALVDFLSAVNE